MKKLTSLTVFLISLSIALTGQNINNNLEISNLKLRNTDKIIQGHILKKNILLRSNKTYQIIGKGSIDTIQVADSIYTYSIGPALGDTIDIVKSIPGYDSLFRPVTETYFLFNKSLNKWDPFYVSSYHWDSNNYLKLMVVTLYNSSNNTFDTIYAEEYFFNSFDSLQYANIYKYTLQYPLQRYDVYYDNNMNRVKEVLLDKNFSSNNWDSAQMWKSSYMNNLLTEMKYFVWYSGTSYFVPWDHFYYYYDQDQNISEIYTLSLTLGIWDSASVEYYHYNQKELCDTSIRIVYDKSTSIWEYSSKNVTIYDSLGFIQQYKFYDWIGNTYWGLTEDNLIFYHIDTVTIPDTINGMTDIESSHVYVYPNPAEDYFFISNPHENPIELVLYSIQGKRIFAKLITERFSSIATDQLPKGLYLFSIRESDHILSKGKIIIE